MYDLVIKNGNILDGTGSPRYVADIAVKDGKIARIGKDIEGGAEVIDAAGLTVTPGFIDSHSHSDNALLEYPDMIEKAEQGITTSVGGQCGGSLAPAPLSAYPLPEEKKFLATMGSCLEACKDMELGSNLCIMVGHGSLRKAVMGIENREPTPEELEKMKELLREGIRGGAMGVSLGLIYVPGTYAKTPELIEIAKVAGEMNALVVAHIRDEDGAMIEAVKEFITIIRESGARGVISHHKVTKEPNFGKVHHSLALIDRANAEGMEIWCDVYPYVASSTGLMAAFVPKPVQAAGKASVKAALQDPEQRQAIMEATKRRHGEDLEWVLVTNCPGHPEFKGKRVSEIARIWGKSHYDTVYDLLVDGDMEGNACYFTINEADVETVLAHPRAMICTDGGVAKKSTVYHPRLRGTFPRVLGRYVRERKVTSLPEMIRKMTSMPAAVYGLKSKGLLWEGMDADICIFDADKIIDRSDFVDCGLHAEGLNYVIIGGKIAVKDAVYTGVRGGRVIRNDF